MSKLDRFGEKAGRIIQKGLEAFITVVNGEPPYITEAGSIERCAKHVGYLAACHMQDSGLLTSGEVSSTSERIRKVLSPRWGLSCPIKSHTDVTKVEVRHDAVATQTSQACDMLSIDIHYSLWPGNETYITEIIYLEGGLLDKAKRLARKTSESIKDVLG